MNTAVLALCALAWALGATAHGGSEVVIAMRYLQAKGLSHAHLYLYRDDGKLLRQLTSGNNGQDRNPIFSSDGTTIVFQRALASGEETWSVEPLGNNLHRLTEVPAWYKEAKSSPFFTNLESSPGFKPTDIDPDKPPRFSAPDGSVELILKPTPDDDDTVQGGKYVLRDVKKRHEVTFAKLPGFIGASELLHDSHDGTRRFLLDGALRLAFFDLHLNSTDGTTVFALDLAKRRLVQLGPNWTLAMPLPGESAFLALDEERYVPIPGSEKTANCAFLERWDANLKKIRFAPQGSAGIAYGYSMYRPGLKPAVVSWIKEASE